jgi:hypothetical protein
MEININIAKSYAPSWGVWEGIRELLQNAFDEPNPKVEFSDNGITIYNDGVLLIDSYILGNTSKEGSDKLGKFGEGFKVGINALLREGISVEITNLNPEGVINLHKFYYTNFGDIPVLHVDVQEHDELPIDTDDSRVIVNVKGLAKYEIDLIKRNAILLSLDYKQIEGNGNVLTNPDEKGRVYIGGLFICEKSDLEYGYNFAPNVIQIDRDRHTLPDVDLLFETSRLLGKSVSTDVISDLIVSNSPDIQYYHYTSAPSPELADKVFDAVKPETIVTSDYSTRDALVRKGYRNVEVVSSNIASVLAHSPKYQEVKQQASKQIVDIKSIFSDFRANYYESLSIGGKFAFDFIEKTILNILKLN